ncbi:hypothetical protein TWF694_010515 [Orbilia ellipsospora]|uniref:HhH-GPD domain-containing protein n=1 Tax=Orbilia ellipsospora TaxID=2528407 RepID=A0AAV9XB96_9PEZI
MARQLRSAAKATSVPASSVDTRQPSTGEKAAAAIASRKRKRQDKAAATEGSQTPKSTKVTKAAGGHLSKSSPSSSPKPSKSKKSTITLGQSPFPDHPFPTPSQCQLVHDLLTQAHGPAIRPTTITASTLHAGCGEVPSVLDSLLRTVLSANTSASNSTRAFRGLLDKYGTDTQHGGVNWEAVRTGTMRDLFKAIESGGLANIKSKTIKDILEEVYQDGKKNGRGEGQSLSLDYLHESSDEEAMRKLTSFKGVGVKTATCVLMFCLRRSAFPVDTHVFRISKLLGWVPTPAYQREIMERESRIAPLEIEDDEQETIDRNKNEKTGPMETPSRVDGKPRASGKLKKPPPVTRDSTFLHLDARVPSDLKYGLHQLMIRHGRYCPTCNAAGGRKVGIAQNGKQLVPKLKTIIVKEENEDGSFGEKMVDTVVKAEPVDSDDEGVLGGGGGGFGLGVGAGAGEAYDPQIKIKMEEASELDKKPYIPIDAAGGTGERTGGNPDGSCILGDLISWERLV